MLISTWLARLFGDILHHWPLLAILVGSAWTVCLLAVKGLVVTIEQAADRWHTWRQQRRAPEPPRRPAATLEQARAVAATVLRALPGYIAERTAELEALLDETETTPDDAEEGRPR